MNLLKLSILSLLGCTAVARAEPSKEANLAIEADLARAQVALAEHNPSAVLEALNDTMRYLSYADDEVLQALIGFQDRFRQSLIATPGEQTDPPPFAPPNSRSSSPDQAATPSKSLSSASAAPLTGARPEQDPKPEPKLASPSTRPQTGQPVHLARSAKPSPNDPKRIRPLMGHRAGPAPEFATASQHPVRTSTNLKLLGYYAQDENGNWVWLPAGSPRKVVDSTPR